MRLPVQALYLLEFCMQTILTHGSTYDRARLVYTYARCKVAVTQNSHTEERKTALLSAVNLMSNVVVLFQTVKASGRVKDVVYYQAWLYHQLGYTAERNRCAHRFKQLDQKTPTLTAININVV